jgi:hypothetical protein
MVTGDTVVFQDEVGPAMDAAFAGGLEVTTLHNHFFYDEPKVYFMHLGGRGEPEKPAAAVKGVRGAIKKVRADRPQPATRFPGKVPAAGGAAPPHREGPRAQGRGEGDRRPGGLHARGPGGRLDGADHLGGLLRRRRTGRRGRLLGLDRSALWGQEGEDAAERRRRAAPSRATTSSAPRHRDLPDRPRDLPDRPHGPSGS